VRRTIAAQQSSAHRSRSNTHFVLAKGVEREDPTSPNGAITYIARSTSSAEPKSKLSSKQGHLDVAGWRIEDEGNGTVTVEHIIQSDFKTDKIKNKALLKTVVVSVAKAPRLLQEFIDERGVRAPRRCLQPGLTGRHIVRTLLRPLGRGRGPPRA
jgi:hypothetical protein